MRSRRSVAAAGARHQYAWESRSLDREAQAQPQRRVVAAHLALLGAGCLLALFGAQATVGASVQGAAPDPPLPGAAGEGRNASTVTAGPASPEGQPYPLLVNKDRPLHPLSFVPPDLVDVAGTVVAATAAKDLEAMIAAAARDRVSILAVSGYRSYGEQEELHARYQAAFGPARAAELSAEPGYSEHQTGLAMDIADPSGDCVLMECFVDTPAGSWAAANAWKFGFIVRYPAGGQAVTGYGYEPWHLRHVGRATASEMHLAGVPTLEAYLAGHGRTAAD